jgi:hypothetical protein
MPMASPWAEPVSAWLTPPLPAEVLTERARLALVALPLWSGDVAVEQSALIDAESTEPVLATIRPTGH